MVYRKVTKNKSHKKAQLFWTKANKLDAVPETILVCKIKQYMCNLVVTSIPAQN